MRADFFYFCEYYPLYGWLSQSKRYRLKESDISLFTSFSLLKEELGMEKSREDSIHSLCIYRLARMFCIVAAAFAVVILCLPFSIQASDTTIEESATVNPKKVLIIGSYTIAWASYPQMISGIQNEIGEQAELQYYFMDTKNVSDEFASSLVNYPDLRIR